MKHNLVLTTLISFALLALIPVSASAVELTLNSILVAQQSGASADGIINTVRNPANAMGMTADDIPMLRSAEVPENVISVIMAYMPMQTQSAAPLMPDDTRLLDIVRLVESGMSEANLSERVRQSGQVYNLSVNDLLYLKQNHVGESTITALLATSASAPVTSAPVASDPVASAPSTPVATPSEVVFDDLILANRGFWRRDHAGQLTLNGDSLEWIDSNDPADSFTFQVAGLEKVWYTCEARASGNFCYQLNFKIVRGDRYKFQDSGKETGSNASVERLMETLRTNFPRLTIGTPSVGD